MKREISPSHRAVIAEHLERCHAVGMAISDVHRELIDVFSVRGKYQMPQISALTSWLRSDALRAMRVNEIPKVEDPDKYTLRESIDFNNEPKKVSREWVRSNFAEHTTSDERKTGRFLILPGQNTADLDMFIGGLGVPPHNLVTYIDGKAPGAVAQYIHNCRVYGVTERRVGDLAEGLPLETEEIRGAYLDYFAPYCKKVEDEVSLIPVPATCSAIPIAVNLLSSRDDTSEFRKNAALFDNFEDVLKQPVHERLQTANNLKEGATSSGDAKESRNKTLAFTLSKHVGIAQTRNWICPELLHTIAGQVYEEYDGMGDPEKADILEKMFAVLGPKTSQYLAQVLEQMDMGDGLVRDAYGYHSLAAQAALNMPVAKFTAQPHAYVSPNGNTRYVTNFFLLETCRDQNMRSKEFIEFYLKLFAYVNKPTVSPESRSIEGAKFRDAMGTVIYLKDATKIIASIPLEDMLLQSVALQRRYGDSNMRQIEQLRGKSLEMPAVAAVPTVRNRRVAPRDRGDRKLLRKQRKQERQRRKH